MSKKHTKIKHKDVVSAATSFGTDDKKFTKLLEATQSIDEALRNNAVLLDQQTDMLNEHTRAILAIWTVLKTVYDKDGVRPDYVDFGAIEDDLNIKMRLD